MPDSQSSTAKLPQDVDSATIQVLSPGVEAVTATVTGSTGSVSLPANCLIVEICTLTAVHFRFGGGSVTASTADRLLPAGAVVVYVIPVVDRVRATHIAFIKATGASDGVVSVGALR